MATWTSGHHSTVAIRCNDSEVVIDFDEWGFQVSVKSSNSSPSATSIDEAILRLTQVIEALKALGIREATAPAPPGGSQEDTGFGRVQKFFENVGNRPATTGEILESTKISRSALSNLIYVTHKARFVSFRSDGHQRKRLWRLRTGRQEPSGEEAPPVKDMARLAAHECCRRILKENGNKPMHVLTLAKVAISRGYRGRGKYSGDSLEWVAAKSFWARLSRTRHHDFEQVEPNIFKLKEVARSPQKDLFETPKDGKSEGQE